MKRVILTELAPVPVAPYSQAIEMNGMLFVSGQVPVNPATGKVVNGDIRDQTVQVMENIGAILTAAGYSFQNVVKATCLLSDMADFSGMNGVYATYFPTDPPARAAFAVRELPLGVKIEIEVVAMK